MEPKPSSHDYSRSHGPGEGILCIYYRLEDSSGDELPFINKGLKATMIFLWKAISKFLEFTIIQEVIFSQQCLIIYYPEL